MTNEMLLNKGRTLEFDDKAEWLVDDRILLVCCPSDSNEAVPEKYALLFHDNIRVGVVLFMGSYDIHVVTFPEHCNKGYMSHFIRSGVIKLIEPELKMTTIDPFAEDVGKSKHLAELAGLICCQTQSEREAFQRQLYNEQHERLNGLCICGSGKKYKYCCRDNEEGQAEDEMQPCWECDAYKSYATATRCWKCGEFY